jgi:hypothetical protein
LLLIAAAAAIAAIVVARAQRPDDSAARFVCPMHPEVVLSEPSQCPICGMDLERATGDGPAGGPARIGRSTFQSYDLVRRRGFGPDVRAPAWVEGDGGIEAVVYKDELTALQPDAAAVFSFAHAHAAPWQRSDPSSESADIHPTADPPEPWDRSTCRVHFRVTGQTKPSPGTVGWVRAAAPQTEIHVVPSSAILHGADGPYVLVASMDGRRLTPRPVETGRVFGGMAVVVSGLRLKERVLVRGAFFVDAERRLHKESAVELSP